MNPLVTPGAPAPARSDVPEPSPPPRTGLPPEADHWTIRTWASKLGVNARAIQVVLGCLWILDGALQFQPAMFKASFLSNVIMPNVAGQPAPIAWFITDAVHFMRPDIGVWNLLFAVTQLAIGVGLLFRRTVRPALAFSCVWALGVWALGEGFGGLLTGTASPLMGAPGAVVLYALIGLLVWPKGFGTTEDDAQRDRTGQAVGVASSA
jgi:hypothetical protein